MKLLAKPASPAGLQRVAFPESFLSPKPSTSGKGPSPRGSPLSAKTLNPAVYELFLLNAFYLLVLLVVLFRYFYLVFSY
jgi:hypothetical protein